MLPRPYNFVILSLSLTVFSSGLVLGQPSNDYHLFGKVVTTQGNPIVGAVIVLRARGGITEIRIETDKDGKYDRWFIPHGYYDVRVEKEGYVTRKGEWDLTPYGDQPIEKEINFTLVSEKEYQQAELGKKLNKLYEEAFKALQENNCEKAVQKAEEVVKQAPDFFGGYFLIGRCAVNEGRLDDAIHYYEKALGIKNDIPEAHWDLANIYAQKGMQDEALKEYQTVVTLQPENVEVLYNIGAIYYNKKDWDQAVSTLEQVIAKKPDHVQAIRVLAYTYAQKGDFQKAANQFRSYLQLNPNAEDRKSAEEIIRLAEGSKKPQS